MQPKTLKLVAIGLVTLSLVLAISGYRLSQTPPAVAVVGDGTATLPAHRVVIAARDLIPGAPLKADDLTVVAVPFPVENAFQDPAPLVGRTVRSGVHKAEMLREITFAGGSVLARETEPGYRAVAVKIDETAGAGGFLLPGDRVDVFYAVRNNNETGSSSTAQMIVRGARILAFGSNLPDQASTRDAGGKQSRSAVLEVPPTDVSRLLLAETTGVLRLAAIGERELQQEARQTALAEPSSRSRARITLGELSGSLTAPQQRAVQRIEVYQGDQVQYVIQ